MGKLPATLALLLAVSSTAQQITVTNAAGGASATNPGVAPGSLIAINVIPNPGVFTGIDPATIAVTLLQSSAPPVALPVRSIAGSIGPVVVLLPAGLPPGAAAVTLQYNSQPSLIAPIQIVASSFGLFTASQFGSGPAAARQTVPAGGTQPNALLHPALPGVFISLWGSGLGSATLSDVTVLLGGRGVRPTYAGPAPGEPGVDQINFEVPSDPLVPDNCYTAVAVQAAGLTSNIATLAKSTAPGPCSSPLALTPTEMASLDNGASVPIGLLFVSGSILHAANGGFVRNEGANFLTTITASSATMSQFVQPAVAEPAQFFCSAASSSPGSLFAWFGSPGANPDFGPSISLSGSGGSLTLIPSTPVPASYSGQVPASAPAATPAQLAPSLFTPGTWLFHGPGGSGATAVPPFSIPLTFPAEFSVANFASLQLIDPTAGLTLTWNPSGFAPGDVASITLSAGSNSEWFTGYHAVRCTAPASAGQAVLPASLLASIPASAPNATIRIELTSAQGVTSSFRLPLAGGESLPVVFQFSSNQRWPVSIQ